MYCSSVSQWFHSKPPLIVFLLTLVACAFTLLALSVHIESKRMWYPDPNVRDWNTFYDHLSSLEFCIPSNTSSKIDARQVAISNNSRSDLSQLKNYTVTVNVEFREIEARSTSRASKNIVKFLQEKKLQMTVTEDLLGQKVHIGDKPERVRLSISVPPRATNALRARACVTVSGPARLLPDTDIVPSTCAMPQTDPFPAIIHNSLPDDCSGTMYGVNFVQQKGLTPLLKSEEIDAIQLHIGLTTLCIVLGILCMCSCSMCSKTEVTHHRLPPVENTQNNSEKNS